MAFGPNSSKIQAHICVKGGRDAIAFYEKAFGARCVFKQVADDGGCILHANLELFGGEVMLHDEFPEFGPDAQAPTTLGGASVAINVDLGAPEEVDAAVERAVAAGAELTCPAGDQFWGARYGRIRDPFGHIWAFNAPLQTRTGDAKAK